MKKGKDLDTSKWTLSSLRPSVSTCVIKKKSYKNSRNANRTKIFKSVFSVLPKFRINLIFQGKSYKTSVITRFQVDYQHCQIGPQEATTYKYKLICIVLNVFCIFSTLILVSISNFILCLYSFTNVLFICFSFIYFSTSS